MVGPQSEKYRTIRRERTIDRAEAERIYADLTTRVREAETWLSEIRGARMKFARSMKKLGWK